MPKKITNFSSFNTQLAKIALDIKNIQKTMATKTDLTKLATKEELAATKEELTRVALNVVKIQQTMATKTDLGEVRKDITEVKQRLAHLEEQTADLKLSKADKSDIAHLKGDIATLNEHLTGLLTRYIESHQKIHQSIEERFAKLGA